jgi:hypothetical protein
MKLDKTAKQEIIDFLVERYDAKKTPNERELMMRCPFCNDSRDRSKRHFYISLDDSKPMLYHCFRASCLASGIVDQDFMSMLMFHKPDTLRKLNAFNRSVSGGGKKFSKYVSKQLVNVISVKDEVSKAKLKYINRRLGTDLTFKDIYNLKINLNLLELLKFNEIQVDANKEQWYKALSDYGISFISAYNDYLIVRDVSKSQKLKKRYTNINIFGNYEGATKFYAIPQRIDLLSKEPIVLNVSEGAFDILGVYYNTSIDREFSNHIYAAANGGGIVNLVMHYIRHYGLLDLKINVFSDSDVEIESYETLRKLKPYLQKFDVSIYRNRRSKDFGVPSEEIDYTVTKL